MYIYLVIQHSTNYGKIRGANQEMPKAIVLSLLWTFIPSLLLLGIRCPTGESHLFRILGSTLDSTVSAVLPLFHSSLMIGILAPFRMKYDDAYRRLLSHRDLLCHVSYFYCD